MIPPPLGIRAVDPSGMRKSYERETLLGERRRWCRDQQAEPDRHPAEACASARFQEVGG